MRVVEGREMLVDWDLMKFWFILIDKVNSFAIFLSPHLHLIINSSKRTNR